MRKFILAHTLLIAGCGCEFDSGSSNYSKAFGKAYLQQCIEDNVNHLDDYSISEISDGIYELSRNGVKSTLDLEFEAGNVTGYTLRTKTDRSQDRHLHKQIESAIINEC